MPRPNGAGLLFNMLLEARRCCSIALAFRFYNGDCAEHVLIFERIVREALTRNVGLDTMCRKNCKELPGFLVEQRLYGGK